MKTASARPADESCAMAAPTNTMRRSTTYTPSTEHASAITSAPYSASRNSRTALNIGGSAARLLGNSAAVSCHHDAVAVEVIDLHGNAVHVGESLLVHDLVDAADAEPA